MDRLQVLGILLTLTAAYCYLNHRWLRLPMTVGVMVIALALSLLLHLLTSFGLRMEEGVVERWLRRIDFHKAVLHGMLSFLLFAGAFQLDLNELLKRKWGVGILATVGVVLSTFFVGTLSWWGLRWVGIELPYLYCLLFGALISPTDAVAVLGVLKRAQVPKRLEMTITGEALFNDGAGIVAFVVLLGLATGAHEMTPGAIGALFLREAVGGTLFGLAAGYLAHRLLATVDSEEVAVLTTLALVTGGYAMADALEFSGPIAVTVAGLLIGNYRRRTAMSEGTRDSLDIFWEMIDHVLNSVLFALMGLESLLLIFTPQTLLAGILAIPLVLLARLLSVAIPGTLLRPWGVLPSDSIRIMTWGGLRGGVSIALALSLPLGRERGVLLAITYVVVVFSILVQGLTLERVVRHTIRNQAPLAT